MFADPLVPGAVVVCYGSYTLTAGDVANLGRESRVTIAAKDEYGYEVKAVTPETVTLEQVGRPLRSPQLRVPSGGMCSMMGSGQEVDHLSMLDRLIQYVVTPRAWVVPSSPHSKNINLTQTKETNQAVHFHSTLTQVGSIRIEANPFYFPESQEGEAATKDTVSYDYNVTNNGLLSLYNISIRDSVLKSHGSIITCTDTDGKPVVGSAAGGELNDLASYPDNGLAPAAQLNCKGTDTISQNEVRA